ncbi:hypothetical protein FNV62_26350 [Streptomyces sp. RLB3-17]|nr:hypothetical protein FNV64_28975 [Streptomyces sp. S1A1-7]QDO04439.1 hypothetical protein FNV58_28540 [Streptomyces sp. RLB1-9]QDO26229.1 hypothetical protein FNV65_27110 [Streptomyces sp. S1A1-8]QDO36344.1 hypothetical protein FNV63_27130 [Streptomyces sp. S1A1-3]QDO46379.1 hypothetical protein FNV62_26350 [Streptomyces sp. RLB3-17]
MVALAGLVVFTVALPLTVASAGPVGDGSSEALRASRTIDDKGTAAPAAPRSASATPPASAPVPRLLGLGRATAARCGPELSSPDGIEAQTCVMTQGEDTWARTYYRNATGDELSSTLSLMGPGGRTVEMNCAVGAEDDPGVCETPRGRTAGGVGAYTAVAEFARSVGSGPMLLRSGSEAASASGSDSESTSGRGPESGP